MKLRWKIAGLPAVGLILVAVYWASAFPYSAGEKQRTNFELVAPEEIAENQKAPGAATKDRVGTYNKLFTDDSASLIVMPAASDKVIACTSSGSVTTLDYEVVVRKSTDIVVRLNGRLQNKCDKDVRVRLAITPWDWREEFMPIVQVWLPTHGVFVPGNNHFHIQGVFAYEPEVARYDARVIEVQVVE